MIEICSHNILWLLITEGKITWFPTYRNSKPLGHEHPVLSPN